VKAKASRERERIRQGFPTSTDRLALIDEESVLLPCLETHHKELTPPPQESKARKRQHKQCADCSCLWRGAFENWHTCKSCGKCVCDECFLTHICTFCEHVKRLNRKLYTESIKSINMATFNKRYANQIYASV
jgi:hypothetical protein